MENLTNQASGLKSKGVTMLQTNRIVVSHGFIEEYKTKNGAWTRRQLELLDIKWPPRTGWKRKVIGKIISVEAANEFKQIALTSKETRKMNLQQQLIELEKRVDDLENAFVDKYERNF